MYKNHYVVTSAVAALLAMVVWFFIPKEYEARIKISDEYRETDIAIGMDELGAQIRDALGGNMNDGINDIDVYTKMLSSSDNARYLSKCRIPGRNVTYGKWVMAGRNWYQTTDTLELVLGKISYRNNSDEQSLYIQFSDRDPYVASSMLNITVEHLQENITKARQQKAKAQYVYLKKERDKAEAEYHKAQTDYSSYAEGHQKLVKEREKLRLKELGEKVTEKKERYKKLSDQTLRQFTLMRKSYCSFCVIKSNTVPLDDNSHPAVMVAAFVILALIGVKGCKLFGEWKRQGDRRLELGDIFAPWTVTLCIWGVIIICAQLVGDLIYPIKPQFYKGISIWLPVFCIVSLLTYVLAKPADRKPFAPGYKIRYSSAVFNIFLAFSVLCTPLTVMKVMNIIMMFGTEDLMYNMRMLAIKGQTGLGVLAYCFTVNKALVILSIWRYPDIAKWKLALVVVLFAMNAFVDMDKGSIFFLVITAVFVMYQRRVISIRSILMVGVVLIGIFFVFTVLRTATEDDGTSALDDLTILEFIAIYVLTTPVAFSYMQPNIGAPYGSYTLTTFYLIMNRLGGHFPIIEQIQEFVWVPLPTNLYTILQPFYLDFGYVGIAFFAVIYGVMCGWAYKSFRTGSSVGCVMYTYLLYYLVLQFSQEGIFMLPVFTIRLVFCLYLLTQSKVTLSLRHLHD